MIKSIAWRDFYKPSDQSCVAVLKLRWGRRRKWEKVWHLARAWYVQMLIRDHEIIGEMAPGQALGCLQEMKDNDFQPGVPYLYLLTLLKGLIFGVDQTFLKVPAFSAAIRACCEKVKQWQHWHVWSTQVWYSRACWLALGRSSPLSRWFKYQFSVTLTWLKSWGSCFQATRSVSSWEKSRCKANQLVPLFPVFIFQVDSLGLWHFDIFFFMPVACRCVKWFQMRKPFNMWCLGVQRCANSAW